MNSTKMSTEESPSFLNRPSLITQSTGKNVSSSAKSMTTTDARRVSDIHVNHVVHGRQEAAGAMTPQEMITTPLSSNAPKNIEFTEYQACLDYVPPSNKNLPLSAMVPPVELEFVRDPSDGSALLDHKGVPITVNRFLATKPLKKDILSRPGPGGCKLTYISGEGVSRSLNDTFGFDGWNLDIVQTQKEDCFKDERGRFHVAYTAQVRVTHKKSGSYKEDCGAGDAIDKIKGNAIANALKASITDAMKRAARHFGNKLGNSLYCDKFNIRNAPQTLKDALEMYDKDRAKYNFENNNNDKNKSSKTIESSNRDTNNEVTIKRGNYNNRNTRQVSGPAVRSSVINNEAVNGSTTTSIQNRTYQQHNLAHTPVGSKTNHTGGDAVGRDTATAKNMAHPIQSGLGPPNTMTKLNQNIPVNRNPLVLASSNQKQQVGIPSKQTNAPQALPVPAKPLPTKPPPTASENLLFSAFFGDGKENDLSALDLTTEFVSRPSTSSGRKPEMGMASLKRQGAALVAPTLPKRPNNNPYMQT